jgi:hypothetical protein
MQCVKSKIFRDDGPLSSGAEQTFKIMIICTPVYKTPLTKMARCNVHKETSGTSGMMYLQHLYTMQSQHVIKIQR